MAKNEQWPIAGKPCRDPLMHKVKALQGDADKQPDQGSRAPDGGQSGVVTLAGRGTMEKK